MIVIGGRNSANTGKLAGTCRGAGVETHQVEREDEIVPSGFAASAASASRRRVDTR
jgi:4-hydroxy-3-methylbut-2-enyl diphosphate reductase